MGSDAGSAFFPEGAPRLHGVAVIVRGDATAEPPAHGRLVSGHDPNGMWPLEIIALISVENILALICTVCALFEY